MRRQIIPRGSRIAEPLRPVLAPLAIDIAHQIADLGAKEIEPLLLAAPLADDDRRSTARRPAG
jgi:hypothetical protein